MLAKPPPPAPPPGGEAPPGPASTVVPPKLLWGEGQLTVTDSTTHDAVELMGDGASLVGEQGSRVQCGEFHDPPAKASGQIIEDEDTDETVAKIVAWLDERKLI